MEQETFAISTDDPFPKNEAKVAVVDFDNFGLTYQDSTIYQLKPVQATSAGTTTMEREFNLFSTKSINSGRVF